MHIVLANMWYPPESGWGGVAVYNHTAAHSLVSQGHQVTMVCTRSSPATPAESQDGQIRVIRLLTGYPEVLRRLPLLRRFIWSLHKARYSRQLANFLAEFVPQNAVDLVEFGDVHGEGAVYLRRSDRAPVVMRCHTPFFVMNHYDLHKKTYSTALVERLEAESIQRADLVIAPSRNMAASIQAHNQALAQKHIHVVPWPLDLGKFYPPENHQKAPKSTVDILHVGRFDPIKGYHVLLAAMPVVLEQCPNARFVFVGGGNQYFDEVKSTLAVQGLGDKAVFRGRVEQSALLEAYHQADLAVVPSLNYESFSYTCAQALACGLPLVASRIGGITETVGDAGILVDPGNANQLAEALVRLCQDENLRTHLARKAIVQAETHFAADLVTKHSIELYQTLLKTAPNL